jgi:hypothetical protein
MLRHTGAMGFFRKNRGPVTDAERRGVLDLATDEDFTLYEVLERFRSDGHADPRPIARLTVLELLRDEMVELHTRFPGGKRQLNSLAEAVAAVEGDEAWEARTPERPHLGVVATDSGWRWHQKHWKA